MFWNSTFVPSNQVFFKMALIDLSIYESIDFSKAKIDYISALKEKKAQSDAKNFSFMFQSEVKVFMDAFAFKKRVKELDCLIKKKDSNRTKYQQEKIKLCLSRENFSSDVQICLTKSHLFTYLRPISSEHIARINAEAHDVYSNDITKEVKKDDRKVFVSVERSFALMFAITKACVKQKKKSVSDKHLKDVLKKKKIVGVTMAMSQQFITSCNSHKKEVLSSTSSAVGSELSSTGTNQDFHVVKEVHEGEKLSSFDEINQTNEQPSMCNESQKDCSQTAIPSVTMNEVAGASHEEKSQCVLSDTLGAIDFTKDVNVRDVSAAASALLDINCQRPVKGNVVFSPPIPSHVVISKRENKDVSTMDTKMNLSDIICTLSNSNRKSSPRGKDTNEESKKSDTSPNGNEKNSDNKDGKGNEDHDSHNDFKQKSDSFATTLSQHMSKKVSNHIMINVFTFSVRDTDEKEYRVLMVMDCMSHFCFFRKLHSTKLVYESIALILSTIFGDFGYPLSVSYYKDGKDMFFGSIEHSTTDGIGNILKVRNVMIIDVNVFWNVDKF